jgi:hypothetical protein
MWDMADDIPLASHEVRWFFEGSVEDHLDLKKWFETTEPVKKDAAVGPPSWKGRLDDQPDVYLQIPGSEDLGIKWREGELQIKGRTAILGTQAFGIHHGRVERWVTNGLDWPLSQPDGMVVREAPGSPPQLSLALLVRRFQNSAPIGQAGRSIL